MNHKIGNCMLSKSKILLLDFSCFCYQIIWQICTLQTKRDFFYSEKLLKKNKLLFGILLVFWEQIWQIYILLKKIDHSQFSLFSTVDFAKLLCRVFFGGLIFVLYCFPNWCLAAVKNKGIYKKVCPNLKAFSGVAFE